MFAHKLDIAVVVAAVVACMLKWHDNWHLYPEKWMMMKEKNGTKIRQNNDAAASAVTVVVVADDGDNTDVVV